MVKNIIDTIFGSPSFIVYSIFKWTKKIDRHKLFKCFLFQELVIFSMFLIYLFESYKSILGIAIFVISMCIASPIMFLMMINCPTSPSEWLYILKGNKELYKQKYEKQMNAIRNKKKISSNGTSPVIEQKEAIKEEEKEVVVTPAIVKSDVEKSDLTGIVKRNKSDVENTISEVKVEESSSDEISDEEVQMIGDMFADLVLEQDDMSDEVDETDNIAGEVTVNKVENNVESVDETIKIQTIETDIEEEQDLTLEFDTTEDFDASIEVETVDIDIEDIEVVDDNSSMSVLSSLDIDDDEEI